MSQRRHRPERRHPPIVILKEQGHQDAGNLGLLRPFGLQQPVVPARVHILQRCPTLRRVTVEWCKHSRHCRLENRLHQTGQQSQLPGCLRVVRTGLLSIGSRKFMSLGWSLLLRFRARFLRWTAVRTSLHLSPFFRFNGTLKVRVAHGFQDIHVTDRDCSCLRRTHVKLVFSTLGPALRRITVLDGSIAQMHRTLVCARG